MSSRVLVNFAHFIPFCGCAAPLPIFLVGANPLRGQCCIGRSARMTERADENDRPSDGRRELVECCADPVAGGDVGGEFVVAATEILDEGMPGGQGPRGTVALQTAHRPEAGFQTSVIGFDRVGSARRA